MKKNTTSICITVVALCAVSRSFAQQGIGTTTPSKAAVLELQSSKKGLLIPRVALIAVDNFNPISGEIAPNKRNSLLVYNTATIVGVFAPGYYYWTQTTATDGKWNRLMADNDTKALQLSGEIQGAFNATTITPNAVTTPKIADNAVTTAKIADGNVTITKIAKGTDGQLLMTKAGAVVWGDASTSLTLGGDVTGQAGNNTIAANAVTTAKIADNAITTAKILDNAVTATKIVDNAITEAKIADNAVTTAKVTDNAVTEAKIANNAITTTKIADNTILDADIATNAAIAVNKLASGTAGQFLTTAVDGVAKWTDAANLSLTMGGDVTGQTSNNTIAANAVTTAKIADNTIVDADIADKANISVAKLNGTATHGQVLTSDGTVATWKQVRNIYTTDGSIGKDRTIRMAGGTSLNIYTRQWGGGRGEEKTSYGLLSLGSIPTTSATGYNTGGKIRFSGYNGAVQGSIATFESEIGGGSVSMAIRILDGYKDENALFFSSSKTMTKLGLGVKEPQTRFDIRGGANAGPGALTSATLALNADTEGLLAIGSDNTVVGKENSWIQVKSSKALWINKLPSSTLFGSGNVGIGFTTNVTPKAKLEVLGDVKITDGTQGLGKVLTSDENGLAKWATIPVQPINGIAGGDLTGNYPNPIIASNAVTTVKIADNAITTAKILDNAVTATKIADNAVTTAKIADNTILDADIATNAAIAVNKLASGTAGQFLTTAADGAVVWGDASTSLTLGGDVTGQAGNNTIAANAVTTVKIANNAITTAKVLDNAIAESKIASNAITEAKVANNAITTAKILDNAVATAKIADNAIIEAKIANNAITTAKVTDNAITESKIVSNAITTAKIADGNVTTTKIAKGTDGQFLMTKAGIVTWSDASTTFTLAGDVTGAAGSNIIGNEKVTEAKIKNDAVTTTKIKNANVTEDKLADNSVAEVKIKSNAVTTAKIADNTIVDVDIATNAAIAVSKLNAVAKPKQVLTSDGTSASWQDVEKPFFTAKGNSIVYTDPVNYGKDLYFNAGAGALGKGTRMLFLPTLNGAFRVGRALDDTWDVSNIGSGSMGVGYNPKATGIASYSIGSHTIAEGNFAMALGYESVSSGKYAVSLGYYTKAFSMNEIVLGAYNNLVKGGEDIWNGADRLFTIGNGTDEYKRSDAMVVLKNGNVSIGGGTPTTKLEVLGNVKIADGTQGLGKVLTSDENGVAKWQTIRNASVKSVTTNYTLINSDNGSVIYVDNGTSDVQVTVPTSGIDVSFNVTIVQGGTGVVTINGAASYGNKTKLLGENATVNMIKVKSDKVVLLGDLKL